MLNEELSFVAMDNSAPDKEGPQHRRRVQEAAKEASMGVAYYFIIQLTYGRKQVSSSWAGALRSSQHNMKSGAVILCGSPEKTDMLAAFPNKT